MKYTETEQKLREALEEIALAGMSGTGQESEEAIRNWHARQAWKFIGIAARALDEAKKSQPTPVQIPEAMTDAQISLEAHNADDRDWNDLRFRRSWHEGFLEGARFAEAHHGITAQAKRDGE